MHSLLKRQLGKLFGTDSALTPEVARLAEVIDESYRSFDVDRELLHRSMEISSEELTQSNAELRAVLQAIPDLILKLRTDGTVVALKAPEMAEDDPADQRPRRRPVTSRIEDIPIPEVREKFQQHLASALADHKPKAFSYVISSELGETYFEARFVPLQNEPSVIGIIQDVTTRRLAELDHERLNKELIEASREAGMAEVATGVLHNVGNVLNSVNVSASVVQDRLRESKLVRLEDAARLLKQHEAELGRFLTEDPKGKLLPGFLIKLSGHLTAEQEETRQELALLTKNIEHIKEIVAMQQNYAKVSGVSELLSPVQVVEDVLRMNEAGFVRHGIEVVREFGEVPVMAMDKHKVMQIVVNLVRNAKHALTACEKEDKRLTVRVRATANDQVTIEVQDNGVGIAPGNLTKIFGHGFTTKKDGHGFGLHSGALAAKEMGGTLAVSSEGRDLGARFSLELPIQIPVLKTERSGCAAA